MSCHSVDLRTFRFTTQEFSMVGDYTENLEKPQNRGWALVWVWVLARDNMVYQLVGLHLVGIIFHILTGSCHTYITGSCHNYTTGSCHNYTTGSCHNYITRSCKKLYNKLHCLLITTQTNNITHIAPPSLRFMVYNNHPSPPALYIS